MKAEALVRESLQELGKAAAEQPVTADAFQTGCRYANRIGAEYAYLDLEWVDISTANDDIEWPAYAHEFLVKKLAIRMAPQFAPGHDLSAIQLELKSAYKNMLMNHRTVEPMDYPEILPIGSGNEWSCSERFYPADASTNPDEN